MCYVRVASGVGPSVAAGRSERLSFTWQPTPPFPGGAAASLTNHTPTGPITNRSELAVSVVSLWSGSNFACMAHDEDLLALGLFCSVVCSLAPCFVLLLVLCDVWLCCQLLSFLVVLFFFFFVLFVLSYLCCIELLLSVAVFSYCCFACHLSVALLTASHSHVG